MSKYKSPALAEAHARSAKRQFEALGIDVHIDPEEERDLAAEHNALMSFPATVGDIEVLKDEIRELKRLILSMKPAAQSVSVKFDMVDAISRSTYQAARQLSAVSR